MFFLSLVIPASWVYIFLGMLDADGREITIAIGAVIFLHVVIIMMIYSHRSFEFRKFIYRFGVLATIFLVSGVPFVANEFKINFPGVGWARVIVVCTFYLFLFISTWDNFYQYVKPGRWVNKMS